jgi:eukaryotic-like serine/threonine-protein kinase
MENSPSCEQQRLPSVHLHEERLREGRAISERDQYGKQEWNFEPSEEIVPGRHALKKLGGGYRYEAYLVWDTALYSIVVAKVVRPNLIGDERALKGLKGEFEMLWRLNHPVILRAFDAAFDGPRPHLVLEHLEGPRLSTLIRKYGWLPPEQLLPLAMQLCSAIHYLSHERVCHLDIKPANIIMSGPPRLIDLSIARSVEHAARSGKGVGTDNYMSPEQCDPDRFGPVGPASDIWGLGASLYQAATGELPFTKSSPDERWPVLREDVRPFAREVPEAIATPLLACLEKSSPNRPTAAELHDELEPLLTHLPKPRLGKLKPRMRPRRSART